MAARTLCGMEPETGARMPDALLIAFAQQAANSEYAAMRALCCMPPHIVVRLPESDVIVLARVTSRTSWWAAEALRFMTPETVAHLPNEALIALVQGAAKEAGWGTQMLSVMTSMVRSESPDMRQHAMRVTHAVIVGAANAMPTDELIAWVQASPPEILAREDVMVAIQDRARKDASAASLITALDASEKQRSPSRLGGLSRR